MKKRILLVDDNEKNRYLVRQMLSGGEYEIEEAGDGRAALDQAHANPPDLVISDILMPGMDGFSLCRQWKRDAQLKHIPLIVLSATFNTDQDKRLAKKLGADLFLNSPVEADFLISRVEALLQNGKTAKESAGEPSAPDEDEKWIDEHLSSFAHKLERKVVQLESTNRELNATLEALRKAEEGRDRLGAELEQFFNLLPDLIFIMDSHLSLLQVNPSWTEILDWEADSLKGRKITEFIHADDLEGPGANFQEVIRFGGPRRFQLRFLKKDGSRRWIECNVKSYPDSRVFGIGRDITEQKEFQKQLVLRDIALRSAAKGVVITRRDGTIAWLNPAFSEMTGYTEEELIGNTLKMVRSEKHDESFYDEVWKKVDAGEIWHGEAVSKRKNGELYPEETVITPVRNEEGEFTHYIAFKEDITERKKQEKQLMRSQRMESIGHLAGGLAHDLNNVLAPITLAIDMLKKEVSAEARGKMLDMMEKSCNRGSEIIRQILTFARGAEGEQVVIEIRHLVKELLSMARETFPPDIEIESDIPGDLWNIIADATQIHQILLNLAVNARDAMPHGGVLTIKAENIELKKKKENFNLTLQPGRHVKITVEDTGIGIPRENLDVVFEPFFTTKEAGKGTGLGLPTVLGIVRSHRGLLEVKSEEGKGTSVFVYLPSSSGDEKMDRTEEKREVRGHGETILVVDDEDAVLQITRAILEDAGYRFLGARDGAEGVALYVQHQKEISLVLTDVIMPVMHGAAMVASLKRINPRVKIIGSSGYTEHSGVERVDELKELGVKTILKKPYTANIVLDAIASEIGKGV